MNGLHITGMKLSSPAPNKKNVTTTNIPKQKQIPNLKPAVKKPSVTSQVQKSMVAQKKQAVKKVEQKKQEIKKIPDKQQKVEEKKLNQNEPIKIQQVKKQQEKIVVPPVIFEVMLRYNHYKQKFSCINNVLSFAKPNEKYCFALVFKGNYQPVVRNFKTRQIIEPLTRGKAEQFSWKVDQNQIYEVQIQEDQQQEAKYQRHTYKAPQKPQQCPMKKNNRADQLTQQMKRMGVNQLGSEKHRLLLEQRDLQDILFS